MKRVPPSQETKSAIQRLLREGVDCGDPKSELVRLGLRRLAEEALEAAVRDLLGRDYYERRDSQSLGSRNGYRAGRLKTSEGEVRYQVPQVRDVDTRSLGPLRDLLQGRTESLEHLALEMFARGCSTRDVEEVFRDPQGKTMLSKSAVSELSESLWEEYEAFATRDLGELRPLYLFVDGVAERLRPGGKLEAILCAWAITWEGKKVLVHLSPGTKESTDCCRAFFEDLRHRNLGEPILVITDGAPGLRRAVEECFPASLRQRCLAHKMRNLLGKVPEEMQQEIKYAARAAYQAPSLETVEMLRESFVAKYKKRLPTAVKCFEEDFDACVAHLHCPAIHHPIIRTTNLLERLFREERRRTRAVGNFFGEKPVLKLMYAALIRGSQRWNGVRITPFLEHQLRRLHNKLNEEFRRTNAPVVALSLSSTSEAHLQQN